MFQAEPTTKFDHEWLNCYINLNVQCIIRKLLGYLDFSAFIAFPFAECLSYNLPKQFSFLKLPLS